MRGKFTIAAQLSTVHSPQEALSPRKVAAYVAEIASEVPLDALVVGWTERTELFRTLTSRESRLTPEVFLWYPLLSDYPGFESSHLVVNSKFTRSKGWAGYEGTGIAESFKQACPNNPQAVSTSLARLEDCMAAYPFDGVFLDKIRFPSAANGLQDLFSCFCPFCTQKAAERGLDLDDVRAVLEGRAAGRAGLSPVEIPEGAKWLERLVADEPLLQRFIRFRADSISALIAAASQRMRALGKKVALDVFSPILAPLVGQDLSALARHADWVKPMIYRFGRGPSSLRTELPSLTRELGAYLGYSEAAAMRWAAAQVEGLAGKTVEQIEAVAPLSLVQAETGRAVALLRGAPLYLGLETVSVAGPIEVSPRRVEEILEIGSQAGVRGFVLSWDLLHTPIDNIRPLKAFLDRW
jgi:hypothetical protein